MNSSPLSSQCARLDSTSPSPLISNMKPRSRFSALEDAIICQGVANGLTWGQISSQLPHRKRATCFNRYRTLQGIRKSRPQSAMESPPSRFMSRHHQQPHHHPYYHHQRQPSSQWIPSSPPGLVMDSSHRRLSTCSTLSTVSSSSSSSSPSLLHHDPFLYRYSRRASTTSTSSFSSSSLSSLPYYPFSRC